jgi:hypothetical protein
MRGTSVAMAGGIVPLHDRCVKRNSDSRYYRYYECFNLVVVRAWPQTHICDNVGHPGNEIAMSRLTIDITSQQHQNLKAMAALQGKTIKNMRWSVCSRGRQWRTGLARIADVVG